MKSVGEFFTEITDIDSRLLKTVLMLFRSPVRVIEANLQAETLFIKPFRYLIFSSTVFIVIQSLYDFLFSTDQLGDWWLPVRIAEANEKYGKYFESFFPFQVLITIIPVAIVLLKLFYLKKTWYEVTTIILYAFGQFWLLMTLFTPLLFIEDNDFFTILASFTIVFICFRKIFSNNFFIGLGKWVFIGLLLIAWFYEVSLELSHFAFQRFFIAPVAETSSDVKSIASTSLPIDDSSIGSLWSIQDDPGNKFFIVNHESNGMRFECRNPDDSKVYETLVRGVDNLRKVFGVRIEPLHYGSLILLDSVGPKASYAVLNNSQGKTIYRKIYREEMILNGGCILKSNVLLLAGGRSKDGEIVPFIDAIKFRIKNDEFDVIEEKTLWLPNPRQRFDDLRVLNDSTVIAAKYEISKAGLGRGNTMEVNTVSILKIRLDSVINILWEKETFRKTTRYSPMKDEAFKVFVDTLNNRIVSSYSLADDELLKAHLINLDSEGNVVWHKEIYSDNITQLNDFHSDNSGIYFCGTSQSGFINSFGLAYRQGIVGHVSADGNNVSTLKFGKVKLGSYQLPSKIYVGRSFKVYNSKINYIFGWPNEEWETLSFKNDFESPESEEQ